MLFGIAEVFSEPFVELSQGICPLLFALFNLIQFFFQASGVLHVKNVAEIFDQQIGNHQPDLGRNKLSADLLCVLPLLDRAQDRRIRGRPPDTAFFQLFHQRSLVVTGWRLGEVLLRLQFLQGKLLPRFKRRQLVLEFFVLFVFWCSFAGLGYYIAT